MPLGTLCSLHYSLLCSLHYSLQRRLVRSSLLLASCFDQPPRPLGVVGRDDLVVFLSDAISIAAAERVFARLSDGRKVAALLLDRGDQSLLGGGGPCCACFDQPPRPLGVVVRDDLVVFLSDAESTAAAERVFARLSDGRKVAALLLDRGDQRLLGGGGPCVCCFDQPPRPLRRKATLARLDLLVPDLVFRGYSAGVSAFLSCALPAPGLRRSLPWPVCSPSFAAIASRLLTRLRLGVAPVSVFFRGRGLVNGGDRWNSREDNDSVLSGSSAGEFDS